MYRVLVQMPADIVPYTHMLPGITGFQRIKTTRGYVGDEVLIVLNLNGRYHPSKIVAAINSANAQFHMKAWLTEIKLTTKYLAVTAEFNETVWVTDPNFATTEHGTMRIETVDGYIIARLLHNEDGYTFMSGVEYTMQDTPIRSVRREEIEFPPQLHIV